MWFCNVPIRNVFNIRMEKSVEPPQILEQRNLVAAPLTEIESSQNSKEDNTEPYRLKRSFFRKSIIITSSSTLTITSYSITATTVTRRVTLGIGGCAACVSCLPSGISICWCDSILYINGILKRKQKSCDENWNKFNWREPLLKS